MPKDLENQFEQLLSSIVESKMYQDYLQLEKKLKANREIEKLILDVKSLQKDLVKLEYYNQDSQEVEVRYQEKLAQLSTYPLYLEFLQKQEMVNEMFQEVKTEIEFFFDKLVRSPEKF